MYILDIAINNAEKRKQQGKALHILALILLLAQAYTNINAQQFALATINLLAVIIICIALITKKIALPKVNIVIRVIEIFLIATAAYNFYGLGIKIAAICFALSALSYSIILGIEFQLQKGFSLLIAEDGINKQFGAKKELIPWHQIKNFIIKDDWVTIDLNNNYIMQCKLTNGNKNIDAITTFCNKQVAKSRLTN